MIKFITGNANKFKEISAVVPGLLEQLDVDLPEIQEFDAHLIIRDKLEAARLHHDDEFIIEDTSLYLDCLGG
jgi:inosine/xanthosine triphosphate pyrophosphatase family protein